MAFSPLILSLPPCLAMQNFEEVLDNISSHSLTRRASFRRKTVSKPASSSWRRSADGMMLARANSRIAVLGLVAPDLVTISRGANSRGSVVLDLKK